MPNTFEIISATRLTGTTANIEFASIPATYTDLVIHAKYAPPSGSNMGMGVRLNSDSTSVYGYTVIYGSTGSAGSGGYTQNASNAFLDSVQGWSDGTVYASAVIHINGYTENSYYKTLLMEGHMTASSPTGPTYTFGINIVGASWESTSVISNIRLYSASQFGTGSEAVLYGIKRA